MHLCNLLFKRIHFQTLLLYSLFLIMGCTRDLNVPVTAPSKDPSEQCESLINQISTAEGIQWNILIANQSILENYIAWSGVTGPQSNRKNKIRQPKKGRAHRRLVHFVNAYNAWILYAYLLDGQPQSINSEYNYSKKTRIFVDGEYSSFSHIKHERLLADFQDPSIHIMLYDLTTDSPPLQFWKHNSWNLSVSNTWKRFISETGSRRTNNGWVFHPMFEQYQMDFVDWSQHDTVCSYLLEYATSDLQAWLREQSSSCDLEYFDLNPDIPKSTLNVNSPIKK